MPPQQPERPLDLIDDVFDFRAHDIESGCRAGFSDCAVPTQPADGQAEGIDMRERLIGTWTLVSASRREIPSGKTTTFFGANPTGYLTYTPEGRMIALIVRGDRPRPSGATPSAEEAVKLMGSMVCYGGRYSVKGNEVTHHVDLSWNELWTGTEQTRIVTFEGEHMHLSTPPSLDPLEGKMSVRTITWEKVTSPREGAPQ
jgi:hypothetical protein